MRWEDFRTSSNVEDRRGMGMPGGAGGLGIGTIIILGLVGWALGIDPRILIGGAEMMAGGGSGYEQQQQGRQGAPQDEMGRFAAAILGNTEDVWKDVLPKQANRQYQPPEARDLLGGDALRLRRRAIGDGAVLLPPRPDGLYRPVLLPGHAAQIRRGRRLRLRLCDRARGRPPCREPARHPAPGAGPPAGGRRSGAQPALRPRRADGRLPRRRLGAPFPGALAIPRAGRYRAGDRRRRGDRRRPPAAQDAGPGRAGFLHPRLLGPARPLADDRSEGRHGPGCDTFRASRL